MRYLFILLLCAVNTYSMDLINDEEEYHVLSKQLIKQTLNADGSFGKGNKDILTSLALLTFMANGETTTSRKYNRIVKNALSYLNLRSKEIVKKDDLHLSDVYVLWAVSESYAMTGVSLLEECSKELCKFVLDKYEIIKWTRENKKEYSHFAYILSNALAAVRNGGVELDKSIDFNVVMTKFLSNSRFIYPYTFRDRVYLRFIQEYWNIDDSEFDISTDVKDNYSKSEMAQVASLLKSLNGNSKERKAAFKESLKLPVELFPYLINELRESGIVELHEVSKDITSGVYYKSVPLDQDDLIQSLKDSPSDLLVATVYYFHRRGNDWKSWYRLIQENLNKYQVTQGEWSKKIDSPDYLDLSGWDKVLFNSCYASLNMVVNYEYLPGFKIPKVLKEVDVFDEEGLDLVE